ncbi:MAG: helix-turn-helix domain-containing protein [Clostridia bacterium]|nr:helix-turn-helix domain-containing protein [Clostridia bacterium]
MFIVITDDKALGGRLCRDLTAHGIFAMQCAPEVGTFYCREKDTGGVLLDATASLGTAEALCRDLRREYPRLPIAALVTPEQIPAMDADAIWRQSDPVLLLPDLLDFCYRVCGWTPAPLSTYYLRVGVDGGTPLYMGRPLRLSPREQQILHCLFYRYPKPTTVGDLMEICYGSNALTVENLAVQIHRINRRAQKIDPRPLIVNRYGVGYQLRDGIL